MSSERILNTVRSLLIAVVLSSLPLSIHCSTPVDPPSVGDSRSPASSPHSTANSINHHLHSINHDSHHCNHKYPEPHEVWQSCLNKFLFEKAKRWSKTEEQSDGRALRNFLFQLSSFSELRNLSGKLRIFVELL